jgi:hypothetical protein
MLPIYGLLIWTYYDPEESMLFGKRWMYKEEPEMSSAAIRYTKFAAITAMVGLPFVLISLLLEIYLFRLVLVIFPLVFVFGALKIFTDDKDSD